MKHYKNLFINQLNTKDVDHFTTDTGLFLRRKTNGAFRKLCNIFTNATIIREDTPDYASDEEYYGNLKPDRIALPTVNEKECQQYCCRAISQAG